MSSPGQSFRDPVYDQYEAAAARQAGIDPALLQSIRTQGERSNADQVSSAGARTVYQIIPQTRAGLIKNYGVDPYSSPQNAALGAALLLKEGLQRNGGNVAAAVGEYHGGTNRANWGPVNAAYRARVAGDGAAAPSSTPGGYADNYDDTDLADLYGIPQGAGSSSGVPMAAGAISKPLLEQRAALDSTPAAQPSNGGADFGSWLNDYVKNIVKNA